AAEEPGAVDRERGARAEDEGDRRRQEPGLERHEQGRPHVVIVPSGAEPLERQPGNGPALNVRGVERVEEDQEDRDEQEQHDEDGPEAQEDASADAFHRLPSLSAARKLLGFSQGMNGLLPFPILPAFARMHGRTLCTLPTQWYLGVPR